MESLGVVAQEAKAYPALLPIVLIALALVLWARDHKRWLLATVAGILGVSVCVLYIDTPAGAVDPGGPVQASLTPIPGTLPAVHHDGARRTFTAPGRFASAVRLSPSFPSDFPIPRSFHLESNSGSARSGNLTVRFRFSGEAEDAVCDLRSQGRQDGWSVEILAPHRVNFRKDSRIVEAWFSFPAHSVVLDIPDPR